MTGQAERVFRDLFDSKRREIDRILPGPYDDMTSRTERLFALLFGDNQ
jgi:hypothetical protein